MAIFTSESLVRDAFQLANTAIVPSSLVVLSMDDAHVDILRALDVDVDVVTPEAGLVSGETLLAGARVLRSLSWGHASEQKRVSVGGSRIEEGNRYAELQKAAGVAESQAWYMLEPYVKDVPGSSSMSVTESAPIIEEG